ncbi:hypothetical protein E4K72_03590 [Oxalobacteraceae bacterium OM1]|nr:hypothetical protein E4K72_03590 [Oxalobacteraceae bacterium OM1]
MVRQLAKPVPLSKLAVLPEYMDHEVAARLECYGLDAFTAYALPVEVLPDVPFGHCIDLALAMPASQTGVLKFRYGFLTLVRATVVERQAARHFVAIDLHDYREAVLDAGVVANAYARLHLHLLETMLPATELLTGCCPEYGNVFVQCEAVGAPPDENGLVDFLIDYFGSGRIESDLNLVFGEALIAHAKASQPALIDILAA